jgi:hypothetical protein
VEKLTISEITNIKLITVIKELAMQPVPATIAFKLAGIMDAIQKELNLFSKAKKELINEHAILDENNQPVKSENSQYGVEFKDPEAFLAAYSVLASTPISFPYQPLTKEELSHFKLPAAYIPVIRKIISDI